MPPRLPRGQGAAALTRLARGLLAHPANTRLRQRLVPLPDAAPVFFQATTLRLFRLLAVERGLPASASFFSLSPLDDVETSRLDEADRLAILALLPSTLAGLGVLHEELLALSPRLDVARGTFDLEPVRGSTRKRRGSYATPQRLIEPLLTSALDPLLDDPLSLKVCDPACGSGGFLLAAAQRLSHVISETSGHSDAFRHVVQHCLYGVDRDPLAVELCKLTLWEASGGEVPLSALDAHIRCGNSLVGVLPGMEAQADPDIWSAAQMGGLLQEVAGLRDRHGFFHWGRELPDVFCPVKGEPGFDIVLGNPPWERVKHQRREWLAAGASGSEDDRRRAVEESRFLRTSGRFPLSARGDLNYYGPFVETSRMLVRLGGRVGLVVPSGIATDDSMKVLFQSLMRKDLVSWYDFHNRGRLFPDVQGNVKFGLLTLARGKRQGFSTAGQLSDPIELNDPGRVVLLTPDRVARLNPNTQHCPPFASARDAELVARLHERFPILIRDGAAPINPWKLRLWTMSHMTKDAPLFQREESLRAAGCTLEGNVFRKGARIWLPLYEAKLIKSWTHRGSTFAGVPEARRYGIHAGTQPLTSGTECVLPRYWVDEATVRARAGEARWFLGFRNAISAVADAHSLVAAIVPRAAIGNSLPLIDGPGARQTCLLLALLNSFVLDYVLRQKASGGNLNFHVLKQLPVPPPELFGETLSEWIIRRVLELTYTAHDLTDFARACGWDGAPFGFDEERRWELCCEIHAAMFHVYGLSRDEVEHVLGSFPVLERREHQRFGCFRSRDRILDLFEGESVLAACGLAEDC